MAFYQQFWDIEREAFLQEPWLGVDAALTMPLNVHPKLLLCLTSDVYLAALTQTTGLLSVSFDRDYQSIETLNGLIRDNKSCAS
jgi:hypothetical protein